jgi:hypothetical protein
VIFKDPVIVPLLVGAAVEVTYSAGEYVSHKGDFQPLPELERCVNQAVTYKGRLVALKDGTRIPVFEDLSTFGARQAFPRYTDVLDHMRETPLVSVLPCPVRGDSNVRAMYEWARALPFHSPGVNVVEDDEREKQEVLMFPEALGESRCLRVEWLPDGRGNLLPWLRLERAVPFQGKESDSVPLGSFVRMRSEGFGAGCQVVSFGTWVQPLSQVQAAWPSRCPACGTPTRFVGIHLNCGRCSGVRD